MYNSCHSNRLDSLHSLHNDQLLVIANAVKQSSFSHSSLRAKRSNPATKQLCLPIDCFGRSTPSQRRFAYQWIATAHYICLAMTNCIVQLFYSKYSDKSFQSGFILSIKLSFFFLFPALSCFSLWVASSILHHSS